MKSDSAIEVRDASYTLPVIPLPGKVIFPGFLEFSGNLLRFAEDFLGISKSNEQGIRHE